MQTFLRFVYRGDHYRARVIYSFEQISDSILVHLQQSIEGNQFYLVALDHETNKWQVYPEVPELSNILLAELNDVISFGNTYLSGLYQVTQ